MFFNGLNKISSQNTNYIANSDNIETDFDSIKLIEREIAIKKRNEKKTTCMSNKSVSNVIFIA